MENMRERQRRPIAAATQHPMLDHPPPTVFAVSNPATEEEEDDPGCLTPRHPVAAKIPAKPRILNKGRV